MFTLMAARELPAQPRPVCLAIGFFDGVHLGHQQVIRQAVSDAARAEGQSVVVTFDRHPNTVVAPERAPLLITPLALRLRALASLGPTATLVLPFTEALSRVPGETFVRDLHRDLGPIRSICVGRHFKFGHRRSGHVELLRQLGAELGFDVHGLAAVALDGDIISSTRIRHLIQKGELDAAGQMLGRPYQLIGTVERGDQLGRTLGFPTANLAVSGLVLPPSGVYAVHAGLRGALYRAVLNIGHRPTVRPAGSSLRVEAHLLEFSGDAYGEEIELTFVRQLREERRFDSLDGLRQQIGRDIEEATRVFASAPVRAGSRFFPL